LNNQAKFQDQARFYILRPLHDNPSLSQRELSQRLGVSLGAVNYCRKAPVERGLVKAGSFSASQNKLGYAYVLTPAGISEKVRLTGRFLARKKPNMKLYAWRSMPYRARSQSAYKWLRRPT
jgi:EPS-associated MarR family transcriptional regulator